jgi:hypothetical protein
MAKQVTSSSTLPASVTKAEITGNEGGKVNTLNGLVQVMYHESLMQDSIKVDYLFADAGNTIKGKSAMEGLPIVGTEDFELTMEDNQEVKLEFSNGNSNCLIVNKVTPMEGEASKQLVNFSLVSEEFIKNEEGETRVNQRLDGKISDHIKEILEENLKTEKDISDIEVTSNNYNFVGNSKKPFYTLNWLSKFGITTEDGEEGKTAGFFFWETSEGYHFTSMDKLFAQEEKKKYIFNSSPDGKGQLPEGYDGKILEIVKDNRIDFQDKLRMGAYSTNLILFDPFNCFYEHIEETAEESKGGTTMAGDDLPKFNKKFGDPSKQENATRSTFMLVNKGVLPEGETKEQIEKNEKETFEAEKILNQGIRRYNQFFSQQQTITIAGDFSLHAGDAIYVDSPSIQAETTDEMDRETGGKYIVADLCHYVTSKEIYTKMNIVRDSVGRKPGSPAAL